VPKCGVEDRHNYSFDLERGDEWRDQTGLDQLGVGHDQNSAPDGAKHLGARLAQAPGAQIADFGAMNVKPFISFSMCHAQGMELG
jgi:hypothetical protein